MHPHINSPTHPDIENPIRSKHDSLPHLCPQRPPTIKLNQELNFFVDFERFKRLSMPRKPKIKKQLLIPVNIHTAKLKLFKSRGESRKSPVFPSPKNLSSLIESSKSRSLKQIDLHLEGFLFRRKSNK
jgi:hypothetical protein